MSESQEPKRSKPGRKPPEPLRRLWKSDSEPEEEEPKQPTSKEGDKKARDRGEEGAPKPPDKSKPASSKKKPPQDWFDDRKPGKKVLVEDTPALDTYQSRQRARLWIGGLTAVSVISVVWIAYRTFLYDPTPVESAPAESASGPTSPEIHLTRDQEARFMFNRAHEHAKNGRTEQAVAMLAVLVKVYHGEPTAREAQAALERPKQGLPLFTEDHPAVVAQTETPEPPPTPIEPPPAVVKAVPEHAEAARGQVALVPPSNPAEAVVAPPSLQQRAAEAKSGVAPRALPAGFKAQLELGVHESGWPLMITGDRDGAPMVLVPGGIFTMGSNDSQNESPAHQVKLSTYYIDQHEVTNRQFRTFLGETQYRGQPAGKWLTDEKARAEPESMPAVLVNFKDAEEFAKWAGKQLPTEAQWEMAARSGDGRRFPWGNEAPHWSRARTYGQVDPIMTFQEDASPYGAFDMAGNVEEWTADWFDGRYFRQFARTTAENPKGPSPRTRSPQKVVKGGSKTFTLSFRQGIPPERRLSHLGFRCVLAVEGAASAPAGAATPMSPPGIPQGKTPSAKTVPF